MTLEFHTANECRDYLRSLILVSHGSQPDLQKEFSAATKGLRSSPSKMNLLHQFASPVLKRILTDENEPKENLLWHCFTDCMRKRTAYEMPLGYAQSQLEDLCVFIDWNLRNYDMFMEGAANTHYTDMAARLREEYLPAVRKFLGMTDDRFEQKSAELLEKRAIGQDIVMPIPLAEWEKAARAPEYNLLA